MEHFPVLYRGQLCADDKMVLTLSATRNGITVAVRYDGPDDDYDKATITLDRLQTARLAWMLDEAAAVIYG
jgi:hypothetical protein